MNRSASIRELLLEAPSTCQELADILGISHRTADAAIRILMHRGQVMKSGRVLPAEGRGRPRNLYELTASGRIRAARERRMTA